MLSARDVVRLARLVSVAAAVGLFAAVPAYAQSTGASQGTSRGASQGSAQTSAQSAKPGEMKGLSISNDKPIQIESDALQISEQNKIATFTGNVQVDQGTTQLRAGKMLVHYAGDGSIAGGNSQIQQIDVSDKVFVKSDDQQATADQGTYNLPNKLLVLSGDRVVLTQGKNVFIGCKLTVHTDTNEANLDSCGKRVMIKLDPKSQKSSK
ncbi:hypothetical protein FJU11_09345 [Pararhizobium mangrovi]|uniref:Organic solvent tolerance-like N-terminal domain-containing protein n=2 Tax=Pararhizobium mangrovi TaxID=2590452 RepID=A0A506U713_9HYPH|nr:hypothetical protein FJU11_09345 [Pararhizobium mangrovi]